VGVDEVGRGALFGPVFAAALFWIPIVLFGVSGIAKNWILNVVKFLLSESGKGRFPGLLALQTLTK